MQIKVFKAGTMKEAMAAMKAELGDDAVILHSKKYKEGGLLGIGSKEIVEITAAVEESSLPEKEIDPRPQPRTRPTLFSSSVANRYKTDGTAQGVAQAEKQAEETLTPAAAQLKRTINSARPTLTAPEILEEEPPPPPKPSIPTLPQEKISPPEEPEKNFEEILQAESDDSTVEVESQSDAEILDSSGDLDYGIDDEEDATVGAYNEFLPEPDEEETSSDESESEEVEETPAEEPEVEEETSPEETAEEESAEEVAEEKISPEEEVSEEVAEEETVEEETPAEEIPSEQPESEEVKEIPEEKDEPPKQPPQPSTEFSQEQFAQAQAMMFAQFNQMQMAQAQVMQQAIAQAQAQAQLQVAEMAEHMREVQRKRLEDSGKIPSPKAQAEQDEQDKIQRLEDEISQMKALLAEVLGKETKKGGISLHEALRRQEVDEDILTEMATHAGAGDTLVDSRSSGAKITLSSYLSEHLRFSDGIKLNRHGVRLVALFGTTGVGKTTTLAKIAAKFVLEHGVNAALITSDTYRISAVDQLKTYSEILGLPLEIVYSPPELKAAIEKHKHKELVLIDTAGRSQQNSQQMHELEEYLRVNPRIEKHLVISATTKLTDAQEILSKFSTVNPEKIIITKLDETGSLGMIINLLRNKKLALSYLTTGQSVPDDIELATADVLTDFILKNVVI